MKKTTRVKTPKTPKAKKPAKAGIELEKGQMYLMNETYVEIVELGKLLAHYRLSLRPDQRGVPWKLGSRTDVAAFLKKNGAKLVCR